MFKLVKKLLGIIGVFKFSGVKEEEDKEVIVYCILYLIGIGILLSIGYMLVTALI